MLMAIIGTLLPLGFFVFSILCMIFDPLLKIFLFHLYVMFDSVFAYPFVCLMGLVMLITFANAAGEKANHPRLSEEFMKGLGKPALWTAAAVLSVIFIFLGERSVTGARTEAFASFSAQDLDGNPVDTSVFEGSRMTLINVWGTFCGPGLNEMPDLTKLAEEYADQGLQVIGICWSVIRMRRPGEGRLKSAAVCLPGGACSGSFRVSDRVSAVGQQTQQADMDRREMPLRRTGDHFRTVRFLRFLFYLYRGSCLPEREPVSALPDHSDPDVCGGCFFMVDGRKKLNAGQGVIFGSFLVFPLAGQVIRAANYGIAAVCPMVTLAVLLPVVNVQREQFSHSTFGTPSQIRHPGDRVFFSAFKTKFPAVSSYN